MLGLLLGWAAVWLHGRPPTAHRTYGWGRFSILAALGNAAILLVSVGAIGIEALADSRLQLPNRGYGATGKLLAGSAKVSLTPVTDEPLHDPVYARSLVLEVNGERVAFVSVDLAVFVSENVDLDRLKAYTTIAGEEIVASQASP